MRPALQRLRRDARGGEDTTLLEGDLDVDANQVNLTTSGRIIREGGRVAGSTVVKKTCAK